MDRQEILQAFRVILDRTLERPSTWRDVWAPRRTPHQEFCAIAWRLFPGARIVANIPAEVRECE